VSSSTEVVRSHGGPPDPTPRCQANSNRIDSYFTHARDGPTTDQTVEGLVDLMLATGSSERRIDRQMLSRHNLRSVSVQHFMAWQRGLALSTDLGVEQPSTETSPSQRIRSSGKPLGSFAPVPNEWEAGLSRRHAARKRNESQRHKKKRSIAHGREGKRIRRGVIWDASSTSSEVSPLSEDTIHTTEHPLRRAVAAVIDGWRSAADDTRVRIQNPWKWIGWTCLGLAAGLGCAMLVKGLKRQSVFL
jgi:hypothetical protein